MGAVYSYLGKSLGFLSKIRNLNYLDWIACMLSSSKYLWGICEFTSITTTTLKVQVLRWIFLSPTSFAVVQSSKKSARFNSHDNILQKFSPKNITFYSTDCIPSKLPHFYKGFSTKIAITILLKIRAHGGTCQFTRIAISRINVSF